MCFITKLVSLLVEIPHIMQLKVKDLLKERGMKMADLAGLLGMDQSNLSKVLYGNPTLSKLQDIANALGVPVRELLPDAPPASPVGVLDMGGKRFALVPLPDGTTVEPNTTMEAHNLTPGALQEKICSMVRKCIKDGRTRAVFGVLSGHLVVVLYERASNRCLAFFWEDDSKETHMEYPLPLYSDEKQFSEVIVGDILGSNVL